VAFAEIEKFLDTPVKHYSSGMYVRLAFSVAAHLEPEILIVDEVLAVGDAAFQTKCLGKMSEASTQGRTVLIVSHNAAAVARLCSRALYLEDGKVTFDGAVAEAIARYLRQEVHVGSESIWSAAGSESRGDRARLRSVRVVDENGRTSPEADIRKPVGIEVASEVLQGGTVLFPSVHVSNGQGVELLASPDAGPPGDPGRLKSKGMHTATCWIPGDFLSEGRHFADVYLSRWNPTDVYVQQLRAVEFQVVDRRDGSGVRSDYPDPFPGLVRPRLSWTHSRQGPRPAE